MRKIKYLFLAALLIFAAAHDVNAQRPRRSRGQTFSSQVAEKKVVLPDSLELARRDSIRIADSLFRVDSAALMKNSSLAAPAFSVARDSIIENFIDGKRIIHYYGDVKVNYQNMSLTAERMDYDISTGTVHAYGVYDSLSGEWKGPSSITRVNCLPSNSTTQIFCIVDRYLPVVEEYVVPIVSTTLAPLRVTLLACV